MSSSYQETVRAGANRLRQAGSDTPDLDAEVIMRHLLGWDRTAYLVRRREELDDTIRDAFWALIRRREGREPIAYITGHREFLGLDLAVGPGALVPRPETEQLVEWAADWLKEKRNQTAVDVGTGSGAIAVGLVRFAPPGSLARMIAVDVSDQALTWARKNIEAIVPEFGVELRQGSLLEPVTESVDLVLANLPYLTPEQLDENPDLADEPASALVSGAEGLDLIRLLIADLPRVLSPSGAAILELDPAQAETVAALARSRFPAAVITILADLSGRSRFVTIER